MKLQSLFTIIIFTLVLVLLTSCTILRPNQVPNPSKSTQSAIQQADNGLVNLMAALTPAEVEYSSKTMKPETEKLYVQAVNSYSQARELLRLWREAVGVGARDGFARKRFEMGLKNVQANMAALSRARGIRT